MINSIIMKLIEKLHKWWIKIEIVKK